jgi:drug/metabolite transporter (DMT)-like permease
MQARKWMLIAVVAFCILAISVKEISKEINSFQIIFFRSLFGLIVLLPFVKQKLTKIKVPSLKKHLFRNSFHLLGQYGWIIGIVYLPLAEVTAIEFSVPIWVLIIAALFLKEKITLSKTLSIGFGFIGVLFVLQPGLKILSTESIIVLLSAISYGIAHVSTKKNIADKLSF